MPFENFNIQIKNVCGICYRELKTNIQVDSSISDHKPILFLEVQSPICPDCKNELIKEIKNKTTKEVGELVAKAFQNSFTDVQFDD